MVTENAPKAAKPKPKMLAKLEGKVFLPDKDVLFKHILRKPSLLMGRSDQGCTATQPFKPAKEGVNVGLGVSNKLSRAHARIELDPETKRFYIHCLGRNGLTVTKPDDDATEIRLTPQSKPLLLASRSVIKLADCVLVFTLPAEMARHVPAENPKKRKRRAWIKAEYIALRALMMRLGYGRWEDIIASTNGRLGERQPAELVPIARDFVAKCYVHARPGVEQKALMEILREDPLSRGLTEEEVVKEVDQLVEEARAESQPDEKRKFVRWARKLRLLSRLRDVHDHPSLERLRVGELRVFTPPPALYWTSADDADLILGSYKHGYGMTEAIRNDPELGFHGRYAKPVAAKKIGTPTKVPKANDAVNGSEEDEDDDEDADEDEDEGNSNMNDDMDEENGLDGASHHPRKRLKLGERSSKKDEVKGEDSVDHGLEDSDMSPERTPEHKMDCDDSEKNSDKESVPASATEKPKKKIVRLVPKRGPRIGNEDGFNDPEDAKLAREKMADEDGLVPFPSSESLMRRLKSIINSCAKEYDRDQRELKKKQLAASRAKQRKDDLAARKAEKEAEKTRQRAERRIAKSQPFSKKEAVEFERALANFGVDYKSDGKSVDWQWFHSKVDGFEQKYDDTLDAAYVELLGEAHRISDLAAAKEDEDYERVDRINEGKKASAVFSTLTLERAERLIERLQFFRVLRGEVLTHKKINSILRGFKKTRDLPLWWKSCHDRSLLLGVDRHGLNGWDFMAVDSELQFAGSMKVWQRKNGNDLKSLKRAAMPKASSGIKRAFALVRYFRSRANDPHFEQYTRDEEVPPTGEVPSEGPSVVKEEKAVVKAEVVEEKPKVLLRRGSEDRGKLKRKADALYPSAPTGRPRTLRATIVDIPRDESGQLLLPKHLGDGLYLLSLGEIRVNVPGFCRNGIVYPVGFKTIRQIGSFAFLNEILETDDGMNPAFRVSALEGFDPKADTVEAMWTESRLVGKSRNIFALWLRVVNQFGKDADDNGRIALSSGPERFGLYESTIAYHIQGLPGAKSVKGFELRDFSRRGEGRKIEPTIGIVRGMLKGIEGKLEKPQAIKNFEAVMTGADDGPRGRPVLALEAEMSIPGQWIESYGGNNKKKSRRKSSSYWG